MKNITTIFLFLAINFLPFHYLKNMDNDYHTIDLRTFTRLKITRVIPKLSYMCLLPIARYIYQKIKTDKKFTYEQFKLQLHALKCNNLPVVKLLRILHDLSPKFNFKMVGKPLHQESPDYEIALCDYLIIHLKKNHPEWTQLCMYDTYQKGDSAFSYKFSNDSKQPLIFNQKNLSIVVHTCYNDTSYLKSKQSPKTPISAIAKKYKKATICVQSSRGIFYLFYFNWIFKDIFKNFFLKTEDNNYITALHYSRDSMLYASYQNKECLMWDLNLFLHEKLFTTSEVVNSIISSINGSYVIFQHANSQTATLLDWNKLQYKEIKLGKIIAFDANSHIITHINNELCWMDLDGIIKKRFPLQPDDQIYGNSMGLRSWMIPSCLLVRKKKINPDSMDGYEKKWHDLNLDYKLTFFIHDLPKEREVYKSLRTQKFYSTKEL